MTNDAGTTTARRIPILILADSDDELAAVRDSLKMEVGRLVPGAVREAEAIRAFEDLMPGLLVLSFGELEAAVTAYQTLLNRSPHAQQVPHQTLVLCKQSDARSAYELCVNGAFDDYVVNRPLYDPYRLRLSVRQAMVHQAAIRLAAEMQIRLNGVESRLAEFDAGFRRRFDDGVKQQREMLADVGELPNRMAGKLDRLRQNLSGRGPGAPVRIVDERGFSQQFDTFRSEAIDVEAQRIQEQLGSQGQWFEALEADHRAQVVAARREAAGAARVRVLVVDDDDFYRGFLEDMLDEAGFAVAVADSGEAALRLVGEAPPRLILLDVDMPGLDGIETLRRIRRRFDAAQMPVIMLTGISERDVVLESIRGGAADFIVKPSDPDTIVAKLKQHLTSA